MNKFYKSILVFIIFLIITVDLSGTNMRIGAIYIADSYVETGKDLKIDFEVRNDSSFAADNFVSYVRIWDSKLNLVFSEDVEGEDLDAFTNRVYSTQQVWNPTLTGKYKIGVEIDYAFDVIPEDDTTSKKIDVIIGRTVATNLMSNYLDLKYSSYLADTWAFMPQEPLEEGDKIEGAETDEYVINIDKYKWHTYLSFNKDFRYSQFGINFTLDAEDSTITEEGTIEWYPLVNGTEYLSGFEDKILSSDLYYGEIREPVNSDDTNSVHEEEIHAAPEEVCAVLVSGGASNPRQREAFDTDTDFMKQNLAKEKLGVNLAAEDIRVLNDATDAQIKQTLEAMKDKYKKIYFYYTGHGSESSLITRDSANSKWYFYFELAGDLSRTNAEDICVILDACHSGAAIDTFKNYKETFDSRNQKIELFTSCRADTTSWTRYIKTGGGDTVRTGEFTWAFVKCYGDPAADSNDDGNVSLKEAFDWTIVQNPTLDVGGTLVGRMDPQHWVHERLVSVSQKEILPTEYSLEQNYPNPFNPSTTIIYSIPHQGYVTIEVFDVIGSEVSTLIEGELPPGNYKVEFDASNLTSGIYFYRIQALPSGRQAGNSASSSGQGFVETKKMILLR